MEAAQAVKPTAQSAAEPAAAAAPELELDDAAKTFNLFQDAEEQKAEGSEEKPVDPAELPKEPVDEVEVPPEPEAKPEEKPEPRLAQGFAQLKRAERKLAAERESLRREREEMDGRHKRAQQLFEAGDVDGALRAQFGISYEDATMRMLGGKKEQKSNVPSEVMAELEALKKSNAQLQSERAAEREAKAVASLKSEIRKAITSKPDDFEYVGAFGDEGVEAAYEYMDSHFKRTGEILEIDEALSDLESQNDAVLVRALTTKKAKLKLSAVAPQQASRPTSERAPATPTKQSPRTLTNSQAAAVPSRVQVQSADPEELISAASAQLRGKLFTDD